jgi:hypothetical protein
MTNNHEDDNKGSYVMKKKAFQSPLGYPLSPQLGGKQQ